MKREHDVLILGGGVAGLAAASELGEHALVLERNSRPGGLVRTACFNGFWFDHTLHILHFQDDETEALVRPLLGDSLAPCPPCAWVETLSGRVRFPFQMNLAGLRRDVVLRCVGDLAEATFSTHKDPPGNFEELLLQTFGRGMCEAFLFPYNRKLWHRPLATLAPAGFTWTITHPDFERVLDGAIGGSPEFAPYNTRGWYPRPAQEAPVRGIEVIVREMARHAPNLLLNHGVERIDLASRTVTVTHGDRRRQFGFRDVCISTLPLPQTVLRCRQAPPDLRDACRALEHNRVCTAAFSVRGPRPEACGHWCYYADETVSFTRLIYMHEFDPQTAPADGWGLMAEITERADAPMRSEAEVLREVRADVERVGVLPENCEIVDAHLLVADPAYVVFTPESQEVVKRARAFLREHDVMTVGRYGRWEYSSMAQVMRDGIAVGRGVASQLGSGGRDASGDDRSSRVA